MAPLLANRRGLLTEKGARFNDERQPRLDVYEAVCMADIYRLVKTTFEQSHISPISNAQAYLNSSSVLETLRFRSSLVGENHPRIRNPRDDGADAILAEITP